jgi:putative ABC transport system permease protein
VRLATEVRHAFRSLRAAPGFTLGALVILGIGMGSATAIFSAMEAVLLRPLPYEQPDRLVSVCETNPSVDRFCIASPPDVMDWRDAVTSLEEVGFARDWMFVLRTDEGATGVNGGYATPSWFRALRARPALGRLFEDDDLLVGNRDVLVLSDGVWRERYGADPGIIGRTIPLSGVPHTVVGVLPPDFAPPALDNARMWTPPPWDPRAEDQRSWRGFQVVGRLADGATIERAGTELDAVQASLAREHPASNEGWGVRIQSLHERITGDARPLFLVFAAAVTLLLLIACANLANLLLVRATRRRREIAVRTAIGAERRDLVLSLVLESAMVGLGGGALGLGLARIALPILTRMAPAGIPRLDEATLDPAAFGFALLVALGTAALFGLAPAFWATRQDPASGLRAGIGAGQSRGIGRVRRILVGSEIALSLALVFGAGLFGRSLGALLGWDPGFDPDGVAVLSAFASPETYPDAATMAAGWSRIESAVATVPGVESVGMVSAGPVFGGIEPSGFTVVGRGEVRGTLRWYDASPGYFRTLGLPIARGRDLSDSDTRGGRTVGIINETLARTWFRDADPIGRRIRLVDAGWQPSDLQNEDADLEIVGVVPDIPPFQAGLPTEPEVWWSNRQRPRWGTYFVVRTRGDLAGVLREVRHTMGSIDPDLQVGTPASLAQLVDRRLVGPRFNLVLVAILAAVALALAIAGLYAVLSYAVTTRRREIAIRMAIGARRADVVRRILGEAATTVGAGIVAGAIVAFTLGRLTRTLLFGVQPADPITFLASVILLATVALLAAAIPTIRATRVDPAGVLRQD